MYDVKVYKLYDSATGLFKGAGYRWTKNGKTWSAIGHVKNVLTQDARGCANTMLYERIKEKMQAEGIIVKSAWEVYQYAQKHNLETSYFYYSSDPVERRKELYSFIPETWIVLEMTHSGVKEYKARDLWELAK